MGDMTMKLSIHKLRIVPTRYHPNERSSFDYAADRAIGGAGFRITIFDERTRGIIPSRGWSGWLGRGSEGARNQFPPYWRGWQGARLAVAGVNGKAAAEPPAAGRIQLTAANTPTVAM